LYSNSSKKQIESCQLKQGVHKFKAHYQEIPGGILRQMQYMFQMHTISGFVIN